ncbi:hypothetical protein FB107DRAFT_272356 [Schizophyllum commune]
MSSPKGFQIYDVGTSPKDFSFQTLTHSMSSPSPKSQRICAPITPPKSAASFRSFVSSSGGLTDLGEHAARLVIQELCAETILNAQEAKDVADCLLDYRFLAMLLHCSGARLKSAEQAKVLYMMVAWLEIKGGGLAAVRAWAREVFAPYVHIAARGWQQHYQLIRYAAFKRAMALKTCVPVCDPTPVAEVQVTPSPSTPAKGKDDNNASALSTQPVASESKSTKRKESPSKSSNSGRENVARAAGSSRPPVKKRPRLDKSIRPPLVPAKRGFNDNN